MSTTIWRGSTHLCFFYWRDWCEILRPPSSLCRLRLFFVCRVPVFKKSVCLEEPYHFRVWKKRRETALGYKKGKTNRTWVQILHFKRSETVFITTTSRPQIIVTKTKRSEEERPKSTFWHHHEREFLKERAQRSVTTVSVARASSSLERKALLFCALLLNKNNTRHN